MSFTRTIEDFVCEHCGHRVAGNGYTNHCPECLFSKHVDVDPGDRQNPCQGLMEPIGVELDHGEYFIIHRCLRCGASKRNRRNDSDNFDLLVKLSGKI
ncbi:MAG: RNHCP domain-containing protein [Candidatus Saccharibacteria bacterium]